MSRKLIISTLVLASMTAAAAVISGVGCQAEVNANASTGANTPTPSATPAPTPDPTPAPTPASTGPKATRNVTLEGQQVRIPGQIEFDSGKDSIRETPEGTQVMTDLKEFLDQNPNVTKLQIEGHTDNVPPKTGTNQALSEGRAKNVMNWLIAKGIKRERLVAVGYGDSKPKAPNTTDANKQLNRRTEFHIVELDGKPTGGGSGAVPAAAVPPKK
jgi:OOP family OmpA-OmpF porin